MMATGINTFKGLAVPLHGESQITALHAAIDIFTLTGASSHTGDFFICEDSAGTEVFQVQATGRCRIARTNATDTAGYKDTLNVYYTIDAAASYQAYAATFKMDQGVYDNGGGRTACLNLQFDSAGTAMGSDASFINFTDLGTDGVALFTCPDHAPSNGTMFQTAGSTPGVTHLIEIYMGGTKYYIMVAAQSSA